MDSEGCVVAFAFKPGRWESCGPAVGDLWRHLHLCRAAWSPEGPAVGDASRFGVARGAAGERGVGEGGVQEEEKIQQPLPEEREKNKF